METIDEGYYASPEFKKRIDKMFNMDCIFGWGFVIWLWITYAFVYFMTTTQSDFVTGPIHVVLTISGLMVCVYNTASISAMVSHYSHEKQYIYTIDLRHFDVYQKTIADAKHGAAAQKTGGN